MTPLSCGNCRGLQYLKCTNDYAGKWRFRGFDIKASILNNILPRYDIGKNYVKAHLSIPD